MSKSNDSDEKNPYYDTWFEHLYKQGFLVGEKAAEKALAFSEEEKWVLEKLIVLSKPCLDDNDLITLKSIKKKVMGE